MEKDQRWIAQISIDGTTKYIGTFTEERAAAAAYNAAAREQFGEFAELNDLGKE